MTMLESDDEFLSYMYYHSATERHLFSREHVTRLFNMAGLKEEQHFSHLSDFVAVNAEIVQPLVTKIRERFLGEAQSETLDQSALGAETMNAVARLNLKGPQVDFHMYLPVKSGRFDPERFSFPWPLAHGIWDGNSYTAEVDFEEDTNQVLLRWNDAYRTRFDLRLGAMLKKGLPIQLKQEQPAKIFAVVVADLSWL